MARRKYWDELCKKADNMTDEELAQVLENIERFNDKMLTQQDKELIDNFFNKLTYEELKQKLIESGIDILPFGEPVRRKDE
jgi:G:T/U-mismatch repair DNA glycosylase